MKKLLWFLAFTFAASSAFAQTVAPIDKFQWTTTDALTQAQGARWEVAIDNATASPMVLTATCAGAPVTCEATIPAVTPTTHTAVIRAVWVAGTGSPVVGPWSDPFSFQMSAVPAKPGALTIVKGH